MFNAQSRSDLDPVSIRPDDAAVRARLHELAAIRRFGYRRLHVLLRREGIVINHRKLRRLYREERLQVRRRDGRKRAPPLHPLALIAPKPRHAQYGAQFPGLGRF